MADPINAALRAHVTRVGFDLSLGRTHIAALVWLDWKIRTDRGGPIADRTWRRVDQRHHLARAYNSFASGTHGLIERGLVVHTHPDTVKLPRGVKNSHDLPFRRFYRITPAGRLVIALLKETGLYEEYAAALPVSVQVVA
jgi:hypothetical protein